MNDKEIVEVVENARLKQKLVTCEIYIRKYADKNIELAQENQHLRAKISLLEAQQKIQGSCGGFEVSVQDRSVTVSILE